MCAYVAARERLKINFTYCVCVAYVRYSMATYLISNLVVFPLGQRESEGGMEGFASWECWREGGMEVCISALHFGRNVQYTERIKPRVRDTFSLAEWMRKTRSALSSYTLQTTVLRFLPVLLWTKM